MWNFIKNILFSKSQNIWLKRILVILAIILIVLVLWRKYGKPENVDGFTQSQPFVLKTDADVYDSFYTEIYDDLFKTEERAEKEVNEIVRMTQPSKTKNTVILDIGSGTGQIVHILNHQGYIAYGIEKSDAMIEYSTSKFPEISVKKGCVLDPLGFEPATFSHILCTHFTIYQITDYATFFSNCYTWLKSNGYLVLHLVDPKHFDTIVPAGKPGIIENPQSYANKRITNTVVDYDDFEYKSEYTFNYPTVRFTETFKDRNSGNVRQNEQLMTMKEIDELLKEARTYGFIAHGFAKLDDPHQYIYVLEKIM